MISHFYLQRSETRTQRQMAGADNYLKEKCISAEFGPKYAAMGIENSSLGDVESAFTSSSIINKVLIDKKESMRKKAGQEAPDGQGKE